MGYKEIIIEQLKLGMRFARYIENELGANLVSPGMIADEKIIDKLKDLGIETVIVFDDSQEDIEKNTKGVIDDYKDSVESFKKVFNTAISKNIIESNEIKNIVKTILEVDTNRDILTLLTKVRSIDEYTYTHSVNVGILAMTLGRWVNAPVDIVEDLLFAGLLHDIGKCRIPDEILNKKGNLTKEEFAFMKKHPVFGYEMSQRSKEISEKISKAILLHHERNDGQGYPLGLKQNKIPFLARVLGIVDIYDAITSDRVYQSRRPPFTAFKVYEDNLELYDIGLSNVFMNNISKFYIGESVRLSSTDYGKIVYINSKNICNPIVKVGNIYIDLSRSDLFIEELIVRSEIS